MNLRAIILSTLFSLLEALHANGAITTLYLQASTNGARSSTVTVKSNEIAQVRYLDLGVALPAYSNYLIVNDGTTSYQFAPPANSTWNIPVIAGPAAIHLESVSIPVGMTVNSVCTISVTAIADPAAGASIPSNAVVIPADSGGPVQIILESSADLVNWNAATPGTYGAQTDNRFFRVRAQRASTP